jgi:GNAT superfamily N-acetyltransferase
VDFHIERVVDDSRSDDWHAVGVAVIAVDEPDLVADPVDEMRAQLPDGSPSWQQEFYVGYADELPVARGLVQLPTRDNLKLVHLRLEVVPAHRRRGYGRAMFEHLRERAVARRRSILVGEVPGPLKGDAPGDGFAASLGAKEVLRVTRSILDFHEIGLSSMLERLEHEARVHASDYEVVSWIDHAPDDLVDGVAGLLARMVKDSPMGEMQIGAEVWDRVRVREFENDSVRWKRARFATGARTISDGRLVAVTEIGVSRIQPLIGYQWDTIVAPEHRGHRLGLLVKAVNARRLIAEMPGTKRIVTHNAETNGYMIAVNERLGFRPAGRVSEWQVELPEAN